MPEPISLGEGSSQIQFCNSDYAISIHAYPRLYQNQQRNGRHKVLVDSGATDCFMSESFVRRMKLGKRPLQKSQKIWNIDNTANLAGEITHYIILEVQTKGVRR